MIFIYVEFITKTPLDVRDPNNSFEIMYQHYIHKNKTNKSTFKSVV